MHARRIVAILAAGFTTLIAAPGEPVAQEKYPAKPIRLIVPLAPGGAIDVFARAVGKEFEQRTGQGFVVENRAGANTIVAANACKGATPDGYTICLLTRSTISINPELYRKLSYEPLTDFEPITNAFFGQQIVIMHASVPVKNFAEAVEYSKKNPDKINFGSFGLGGDSHLIIEWIKHTTGARFTHIPYKGASEAMLAFKSGDVHMIALLVGNPDIARQVRDGEIKGLLIPGSKRSPLVPDVPTFAEAGLSADETAYVPWFGFFAPKGTSKEMVQKLNAELVAIIRSPEFRDRFLVPRGFTPVGNTPEDFAKFLVTDRKTAAQLVSIANVKLDQ
jgi:tripartite-type tricarboxylate transporter receptor subunit TctC